MKDYEAVYSHTFTKRSCLIIRVDGRSFHNFTKDFSRPFDADFVKAMVHGASMTACDMAGFKLAYVQSDEASFLITDYDDVNTQGWFNYEVNKIVSISASLMTIHFYDHLSPSGKIKNVFPNFDSRAFIVPQDDVANYFVWRAKDWARNSLNMYARSFFSQKEMHGKGVSAIHEMLHQRGKNWATDLDDQLKNGTYLMRTEERKKAIELRCDILPNHAPIQEIIQPLITPGKDIK